MRPKVATGLAQSPRWKEGGMDRYFVVIFARDAAALRALQKFELDVFPQTAKRADVDKEYPYSIDGLLSVPEIEKVVKAGYRVLIEDPIERRARGAGNVAEFPQWLQQMEDLVSRERRATRKK
jgi:hypothetical protein